MQRCRILLRHVNAAGRVRRTGAARHHGDAGAAGHLAVGLGHHRRAAFVPCDHDIDVAAMQPVEQRQESFRRARKMPASRPAPRDSAPEAYRHSCDLPCSSLARPEEPEALLLRLPPQALCPDRPGHAACPARFATARKLFSAGASPSTSTGSGTVSMSGTASMTGSARAQVRFGLWIRQRLGQIVEVVHFQRRAKPGHGHLPLKGVDLAIQR